MIEICVGLAVIVLLILLNPYTKSRLEILSAQIPGSRKVPFLGTFGLPRNGKELFKFRKYMIDNYGPIYKYWLGNKVAIEISDPKDAQDILSGMNTIQKGPTYLLLEAWLGTGLLTSTGVKWQTRRKALTPTFHFKILQEFMTVFNRKGQKFLEIMEGKADGKIFNIFPYISNYTLDVICETAMGIDIHAQENKRTPYLTAVKGILDKILASRAKYWTFAKYLLFSKDCEQEEMLKVLHGFTNMVIQSKKLKKASPDQTSIDTNSGKKTAFLDLLINLSEIQDSSIKSDKDIREEVDTFMFEGHDTVASSIASTVVLLAQHQDVQEKVFNEVCSIIPRVDYDFTYNDIQEMKYTEMVIKESLRLYPSVPSISRTLTSDIKVNSGYTLPAGSAVFIDIYNMQRNPDYFPNPEKFNPDNFLPENAAGRHPYAYVPFSSGPRNCIGQKFAMLEMKSTLAKLVYKYKLDTDGPEEGIDPSLGLIFKSVSGNKLKLSLRK